MSAVMNGVPAQVASGETQIAWPCKLETNFAGPLLQGLKAVDKRDAKAAANGSGKAGPKPNGENGDADNWGLMPIPNVGNGADEDRLLRAAREMRPCDRHQSGQTVRKRGARPSADAESSRLTSPWAPCTPCSNSWWRQGGVFSGVQGPQQVGEEFHERGRVGQPALGG